MEAADARREAGRLHYVHERPSRVGGAGNYCTAIMQKQKAVRAASSGLEIQVNCFGMISSRCPTSHLNSSSNSIYFTQMP